MPVVTTSPYPTAEEVLQATRVKINDAGQSINGNILSDAQPYTFPMLSLKYKYMQDRLIAAGINTFEKYGNILGVPVIALPDPGAQIQIDYVGTFDGLNNKPQPVIPVDCIEPLEFWERPNVASPATNTNPWLPMKQASDSIGTRAQTTRFYLWDWQDDTLFLPGATQINDLKLKYLAYMPEITGATSQLLVARCTPAMSALMAAEVSRSRGGLESAQVFEAEAERELQQIISRYAQKEQYASHVRRPFRARRSRWR